jgi:translocation and assembly module TamB
VQGKAAQTLTSDLITANVDMQLTLSGPLLKGLEAAGNLHINRADIHIPDAFPPDVAVLDVRRPGQKIIAPEVSLWSRTALKVAVDAPRAIFVRGRGIDAEVGGTLQVSGTIGEPLIDGGLDLRNGTVALAGATLTFDSGSRLSFNGTGVQKKINPTLDFSSTRSINGITAKLSLSGYATAPAIKVSSTPEETPDYILALLLFGVPPNQLSTFQIAQIAAALATMTTGIGGGFNPLNAVQRKLGLDRLAISGTTSGGTASGTAGTTGSTSVQGGTPSTNPAATLEAGRYVTRRIYLGAKQSTTGSTQAEVQVDLTKHLKVQSVLGTGGGTVQGATPQNDPGSSIGLSYQLEY